jgi:ribonucleotide monophosphatase NagD (HAD superfamily)
VLSDLGATAAATAMVGDDIESDIGGALPAGLAAILVRTGKYHERQMRESGIEPPSVVESIADVPSLLGPCQCRVDALASPANAIDR